MNTHHHHAPKKGDVPRKRRGALSLFKKAQLPALAFDLIVISWVMTFPLRPRSKQVHPVLQQLLLGFSREAEGPVLGTREAGAPRGRRQLLEVGFLDRVAAGVHGSGGISAGAGEKAAVGRCPADRRPETARGAPSSAAPHTRCCAHSCRGSGSHYLARISGSVPITAFPSFQLTGCWDCPWHPQPEVTTASMNGWVRDLLIQHQLCTAPLTAWRSRAADAVVASSHLADGDPEAHRWVLLSGLYDRHFWELFCTTH